MIERLVSIREWDRRLRRRRRRRAIEQSKREGETQQERTVARGHDVRTGGRCAVVAAAPQARLPFSAGSLLPFVVGVFPMIHMSG